MIFAAVVFVLVTGCAWRHLPPIFGVSKATARRRFRHWTSAGLWTSLTDVALSDLGGDREFGRPTRHRAEPGTQ